jgi:transposase-like protein
MMERKQLVGDRRTDPSPEVLEKPVRRRFTVEYKAKILAEADACTEPGQLGELLRREGLYSSHVSNWRKQRDAGALAGLAPRRRGRKARPKNPHSDENERLRRENQRLKEQLRQAELIIDVQKKVSEMLDIPLKTPNGDEVD